MQLTAEQEMKRELLKEHYIKNGKSVIDFLHDAGALRGQDPRFPDVPLGEIFDKMYDQVEKTGRITLMS